MNSKTIWTELEKKGVKPGECEVITNISKNGNSNVTHRIKYLGDCPVMKQKIKNFELKIQKPIEL